MRRFCRIFLIFSLLLPLAAQAQDIKTAVNPSDMVDIEADRLDVSTRNGAAVFRGNVKATRGDIVVRGNSLALSYDQKTRKVTTLTADGNVSILWQGKEATCSRVVYSLNREVMVLTGNVIIVRGQERLSGQKVTLDLKNDSQTVEGGGGRVNVRVNAEESTGIMQWKK
jgi:lipopolysaccharide export system protein LptA